MLVFLDTEFTNHASPDLISLGIATVGANDFYAERTDYNRAECSPFVMAEIVPLLDRVPGAACCALDLSSRLCTWFNELPEPAIVLYDFETDWWLLEKALSGNAPNNIEAHELIGREVFRHPAYKLGEVLTYSPSWPPHHALADAQAFREGYIRWEAAKNGLDWRR